MRAIASETDRRCKSVLVFYLERYQTLFSMVSAETAKRKNFQTFDRNHGQTPLEKCQILNFFKLMFL